LGAGGAGLGWEEMCGLQIIEVGHSGGEDFLHLDAQWWLSNSANKTRFMILVNIIMTLLELRIECWRMLESGYRENRLTPARVPTCVQEFNINAAGVVKSRWNLPSSGFPTIVFLMNAMAILLMPCPA